MIQLITANKGDLFRVQNILEQTPTYHLNVGGRKAMPNAAELLFETVPQKKLPEDKLVLIVREGLDDVGIVDLIHGYPNLETAFLGFLAIIEGKQNSGIGKATYLEVEKLVKEVGLKKIRLSVVGTNPVDAFWEKMGFHFTGETKDYRNKKVHSISKLMEKELT